MLLIFSIQLLWLMLNSTLMLLCYHTTDGLLSKWTEAVLHTGSLPQKNTTVHSTFEVLDLLAAEIARRFNQSSLALPLAVEELLIGYVNNKGDEKMISEIIVDACLLQRCRHNEA